MINQFPSCPSYYICDQCRRVKSSLYSPSVGDKVRFVIRKYSQTKGWNLSSKEGVLIALIPPYLKIEYRKKSYTVRENDVSDVKGTSALSKLICGECECLKGGANS